jgi:hypothetical protein
MKDHEKKSQEKKKEHDLRERRQTEADGEEEIEEKKVYEGRYKMEESNTKTLEVNTEKKRMGSNMVRTDIYFSSSDSSTSNKKNRASCKQDKEVGYL